MKKQTKTTILDNGYNRFQTQCFGCGCVYEYDIKNVDFRQKKAVHGLVRCPICGRRQEHRFREGIRSEDVFAKYEDKIKKELVPKIAKDMISHVNWCIGNRIDFGTEDNLDFGMISKWWEKESSYLSERYERPNLRL